MDARQDNTSLDHRDAAAAGKNPPLDKTVKRLTFFNRLIDEGWLRRLTEVEKSVWLVIFRHANTDEVAFPSANTIAERLGHRDPRPVQRAKRRLEELGLLEKLDTSGGDKLKGAPVRLIFPGQINQPTPGQIDQWSNQPVANLASDPRSNKPAHPRSNRPAKQNKEQNKEQNKAHEGLDEDDRRSNEPPPGLELFWTTLPKKARERSSKKQCWAEWRKLGCEADATTIIAALEKWKLCNDWTKEAGQFIPGAHRWLKAEKWRDVPDPTKSKPQVRDWSTVDEVWETPLDESNKLMRELGIIESPPTYPKKSRLEKNLENIDKAFAETEIQNEPQGS